MALLRITDEDGRSHVVHSSIFDAASRKLADEHEGWGGTWARFDQMHPPRPRMPDS